jgi:pyocin large subunit-like protein
VPFKNAYERGIHFKKHGADFGAATEVDYEAMADYFMCFGPMNANTQDCTRAACDDYLRMQLVTTDFGVTCISSGFLRTFYRPLFSNIWHRGGAKRFLEHECARVDI